MHHCLRTTEILLQIFSEFDPRQTALDGAEIQRSRCTLSALARTCQAFKDPALDVLWARLNSIDPLTRCLPSDAWRACVVDPRRRLDGSIPEGATRYLEGSFRLTRPLTANDWSIIMPFAQRVRELAIYSSADSSPSSAVLLHMLDSPSAPLLMFPSLRALYWSDNHKEALPCLERCLSPTLSHLHITSYSGAADCQWTWDSVKTCILDALAKMKPYLLEFECRELPLQAIGPLSDLICGWTQLRVVRTIILNARASIHLTSLSSLRELHISTPLGWGSVGYRFTLPSTGVGCLQFPETLEKLAVSGPGFFLCTQYLGMLRAAPLSLSITSSVTNTAVEIQDLLNVLVDHISPHRLRSLRIAMAESAFVNITHMLSLASVEPLTKFTQLEDLDLATLHPGSIQDGGINRLVSAWPNLKRFFFGTEWDWAIEPSLTFQGL